MDMPCPDNDPNQCIVFAGEPMQCKKALAGWQNCCDSPVSVGLGDYLRLTMATYDVAKKLGLQKALIAAGENGSGSWAAIADYASSTWSEITQPFTSAFESLVEQPLINETARFVSETFGSDVADIFFTQTGVDQAGDAVYELSDTFATALTVVMWIYTIYLIVNILVHLIWKCEQSEFMLAARRQMSLCDRIGTYCKENSVFGCIETEDSYCCYNSPLSRIVMEAAHTQFGIPIGTAENPNCSGLTISQLSQLNWDNVDLKQWYGLLAASGVIPSDPANFDTQYALDNVTRHQDPTGVTPNAPERIQSEVDGAQYFDEAREKVRQDLWNGAR
jgi:conjugal transfer mating pair stabilization protein TraN